MTNVFTLGALAFFFFGDDRNKCAESWNVSPALYAVAARAIRPARDERYPSVDAFADAGVGRARTFDNAPESKTQDFCVLLFFFGACPAIFAFPLDKRRKVVYTIYSKARSNVCEGQGG